MGIQFSIDDLRNVESTERVLRQFQHAIDSAATLSQSNLEAAIAKAKADIQAAAAPPRFPALVPGAGINIVQTPAQISIINTGNAGVTSAIGTANQVNVSAATGDVTFSTPQNIDTGASVQFGALNIAAKLIVNSNGLPTKSNNVTLAGQGNAIIVAQGSATAQTGAVASVAAYTTTAAGGSFEIGGYIDVTAFTAGTISLLCDYTDPGGTARTLTIPLVALAGTIGTTVGAATDAQALVVSIQTSGANAIKIYTTVAVFTGTYNVYGWIKQIA